MRNPCQHHTEIDTDMNDPMTSVGYLEWLHLEFACAWKRLREFYYAYFVILNVFFIIDNQRGILPYKFDNYLAVHEERKHITYVRTYCSVWTVLYMETVFFFPLIYIVVCTVQRYHILDAVIKYFA